MVRQIDPYLSHQQSRWSFKHTVHKIHPNLLKPKLRVAHSATSKRFGGHCYAAVLLAYYE